MRALVSKGWGNVGGDEVPDSCFMLDNVPHDWLFPRVSAVVHHGGAGTTAIGVALGKPTVIVPFFGDQPFWASMVYKAGSGPEPVAFKALTAEKLAESIKIALKPEVLDKARELAERIKGEDGPTNAAKAFHNTPQMSNVGCFLCPDRVAVWRLRRTNIQLSVLAAAVLVTRGELRAQHLKLVRHKRWYVEEGSADPLTGIVGALSSTATGLVNDIDDWSHAIRGKREPHRSYERSSWKDCVIDGANNDDEKNNDSDEKEGERESSSTDTSIPIADSKKSKNPRAVSERPPVTTRHPNSRTKQFLAASGDFIDSSVTHVTKLPVALLYNLSNGFHNFPASLGDKTVRVRDPITGIWSGMKVGAKEFVYGNWDGFSGVVTQPYHGFEEGKEGRHGGPVGGLAKGVGLGLTGLVFKVPAAFIGPFGYSAKGLERMIQKWWAGTDHLSGKEIEIIMKARDEIKSRPSDEGESGDAAKLMWNEARGAGAGKRIVERRVWQGYREVKELRVGGDSDGLEEEIMQAWKKLGVDRAFLDGLMP